MNRFLFVCSGNICRSPALQGVLEHLLAEKGTDAYVDSCGTHGTFLGNSPDRRMQEVANANGVTLKTRAKVFERANFDQFDYIFCVNEETMQAVQAMATSEQEENKVMLATQFSKNYHNLPIPDPYFGGEEGFNEVWNFVEDACRGILKHFYLDKN